MYVSHIKAIFVSLLLLLLLQLGYEHQWHIEKVENFRLINSLRSIQSHNKSAEYIIECYV